MTKKMKTKLKNTTLTMWVPMVVDDERSVLFLHTGKCLRCEIGKDLFENDWRRETFDDRKSKYLRKRLSSHRSSWSTVLRHSNWKKSCKRNWKSLAKKQKNERKKWTNFRTRYVYPSDISSVQLLCSDRSLKVLFSWKVKTRYSKVPRWNTSNSSLSEVTNKVDLTTRLRSHLRYRYLSIGSAAEVHFRLAESQFYRLLSGYATWVKILFIATEKWTLMSMRCRAQVSKVEYVCNPVLIKKFK